MSAMPSDLLRRGLVFEAQAKNIDPVSQAYYCLSSLAALTAQLATADTRARRDAKRKVMELIEVGKGKA